MVSKVIQEYGNNGFCLYISHKKVGLKIKRIYFQKNRICLLKKVRRSPFSEKKVLRNTKTGIANSKIHKNRIYQRKKGDDRNRKKKDFFQPNPIKGQCNGISRKSPCYRNLFRHFEYLKNLWFILNFMCFRKLVLGSKVSYCIGTFSYSVFISSLALKHSKGIDINSSNAN